MDTRALTTRTMLKLIDCLVNPVAMYSCQIWLPFSHIMKETTKPNCYNIPQCASKDALESTHLKMLKCDGCLAYTRKRPTTSAMETLVDYLGQSRSYPSACVILSGCLRPLQEPTVPTHLSIVLSKGRKVGFLTWYTTNLSRELPC